MYQGTCRRWSSRSAALLLVALAGMLSAPHDVAGAPYADRLDDDVTSSKSDVVQPVHETLFDEIVTVPDAAWIRLRFGDVTFSGFGIGELGYLRITSLLDGAVHRLDAVNFERWHHYSAYFNGDAVRIEAIGNASSTATVVEILDLLSETAADPSDTGAPRTICGNLDDRLLSSDPRVARIVIAEGDFPSVCTTSIISDANRCLLTSGGCAGALSASAVVEFNAPLTFPNGTTLNHPSPDDQYVADLTSIQRQTGPAGSDWGYFGCFPNSNTGLTPFESQGDYFELAAAIPAPSNQNTRMFGNGNTVPPVFRSWSFVQKQVDGPFVSQDDDALSVATDATAGDSGAAITLESTGELIGILVDDGCAEFSGANEATSVNAANLRKALTQPLGVCIPITFDFFNGMPEFVNPNGGTTLQVLVSGANDTLPEPDSGQFHYNDGSGWITAPMTELSPGVYEATFAPTICGTFIDYYVSVETSLGVRFPDQISNPLTTFQTVAANGITLLHTFDFEDALGWTTQDGNVTAGGFERGIPAGNGSLDGPSQDADGSGQCWATGLAANVDLDGGPTRLRSPTFDLSGATNPFLTFSAWFTTDDATLDKFVLQYSDSGGLFWTSVDEIGNQGPGWVSHRYRIADFGALSAGTRFRISVSDFPNNSNTEAALDAFTIIDYECPAVVVCTKGDFNGDLIRDGQDIAGLSSALIGSPDPGSVEFCAADMDDDGELELTDDLDAFVQCLLTESCP